MKPFPYSCSYCDKKYKTEKGMAAHECPIKARAMEMKTMLGQTAYDYYKLWNRMQGRMVPKIPTFLESNHYTSMIKFAKFVVSIKLPDVQSFISLMIDHRMQPNQWCSNVAYAYYIDFIDKRMPPNKQIDITVHTILKLSEDKGCEINEVFDDLAPGLFLKLVIQRQLSPWVLFHSEIFGAYEEFSLNAEQRKIFHGMHSPIKWKAKFAVKKEAVKYAKEVVAELEL